MNNYESAHAKQYEPSVCALYLHWFLSIPALMDCAIRLTCHAFLLLFMALTYYIIYCIMCGKHQAQQNGCFDHQFKMYGLYSGLLCGVLSNLCQCRFYQLFPSKVTDFEFCYRQLYHGHRLFTHFSRRDWFWIGIYLYVCSPLRCIIVIYI